MKADKDTEIQKQPPRSMSADQININKHKSGSSASNNLNSKHNNQHVKKNIKGKV